MASKSEKIFQVSLSVFSLESSKGHLGWKVTELERKSKMSRSLIYRYLGSSKQEIYDSAFDIFINEFYGFSDLEALSRDNFANKIKGARHLMEAHPEAILFYQKWRATTSPKADVFKKIEGKFQKNLSLIFPKASKDGLKVLHGYIHGLVTSPFLEPEDARIGAQRLLDEE